MRFNPSIAFAPYDGRACKGPCYSLVWTTLDPSSRKCNSACTLGSVKKLRHYRGGFNRAGRLTQARELRTKETKAESRLWSILRNRQMHGFKFRRQHQFGNYIADFYCHEAQLVIECDGSIHETNENWQHDQTRDAYMIGQGLRVLRFANEEVLNNTQAIVKKIQEFLNREMLTLPPKNKT